MKVKVLFHDGTAMFGKLIGDEIECLKPAQALDWIMNNNNDFIYVEDWISAQHVQVNKNGIDSIVLDDY